MRRLVALLLLAKLSPSSPRTAGAHQAGSPALVSHRLQWFSWSSWGSKHLLMSAGQPDELIKARAATNAKTDDDTPQPRFSFELQPPFRRATAVAAGKTMASITGRRGGWRSSATSAATVAPVAISGAGPWGGLNAKDFGAVGDGCEWHLRRLLFPHLRPSHLFALVLVTLMIYLCTMCRRRRRPGSAESNRRCH
eukprot:COSAG05_NODE_37_length_27688_cov_18.080394_8_plen_195_part_00